MILKLLTGGIDLPKLDAKVSNLEPLGDHIGKANMRMATIENVVSSRALAEDVETLRLKLNRIAGEVVHPGEGYIVPTLATDVADLKTSNANLIVAVASLSKQVEALTAAKLGEVKARKAPAKK